MKPACLSSGVVRCAIYTRKSSEEGLEQSFNSLHAQREACEACVLSQRHEGWQVIATEYDDGGFSGGTMDRPALKRLLADVAAKKVDTIVVYKVDRLTRSLTDFSRIVEAFDKQGVSFVSVTQQFNTTTSMGRLTLNVLLSFAQFEREVTGERIRDKIAASKRKGMWMGGVVPLGYTLADRQLIVEPNEAETVKQIYALYLKLGCVSKLQDHLEQTGIRSKKRISKTGTKRGDVVFSRGALYCMLQNQIYLGKITHKDAVYQGSHTPIVDQATFDRVQAQFADNLQAPRTRPRHKERSILTGLLFDPDGNRFIPSHANKKGKRYRYYVSQTVVKPGKPGGDGPMRIPADDIEQLVLDQLTYLLHSPKRLAEMLGHGKPLDSAQLRLLMQSLETMERDTFTTAHRFLTSSVTRIVMRPGQVDLLMSRESIRHLLLGLEDTPVLLEQADDIRLEVSANVARCGGEVRILLPADSGDGAGCQIPSLTRALVRAHEWVDRMLCGDALDQRSIAKENGLDERYVSRILPLAFLAPDITEAILNGTQSAHLSLISIPGNVSFDWDEQRNFLHAVDAR